MPSSTLNFLFLKSLPNKFLKIILVLWRYERAVRMNKYKAVFPTREKIAFEAGCSVDRVKQFNQMMNKYRDPAFMRITQRIDVKTKKNQSNLYEMDRKLFDLITMLDSLGYFKKWEKIKDEIYIKISENENFIHDLWKGKKASYEQRITRGFSPKLPAIKEPLIKEVHMNYGTLKNSAYYISFFKERGLGKKTARFIELFCPEEVLRQIRNDYAMYTENNEILSINGWIRDRALEYIPQQQRKALSFFS